MPNWQVMRISHRRTKESPSRSHARLGNFPGVTLLELTVVIVVLLSLSALLFIGARSWKRGSDRTLCLMNIRAVQQGVRGYGNVNGIEPGQTREGLEEAVIGPGRHFPAIPECPGNGTYTTAGDLFPPLGELYLGCDLAETLQHELADRNDW